MADFLKFDHSFDSHSLLHLPLRHLRDFVRQTTIFYDFVRLLVAVVPRVANEQRSARSLLRLVKCLGCGTCWARSSYRWQCSPSHIPSQRLGRFDETFEEGNDAHQKQINSRPSRDCPCSMRGRSHSLSSESARPNELMKLPRLPLLISRRAQARRKATRF